MFDIYRIFSKYELLELTAQYLSTMDLYHVALTCSDTFELIMKLMSTFHRLRRVSSCDGSGLKARQDYAGVRYSNHPSFRRPREEEVELQVWNLRCDESSGLSCVKCGINVCEECRYVPRVGDPSYGPCRRPHHTACYSTANIISY